MHNDPEKIDNDPGKVTMTQERHNDPEKSDNNPRKCKMTQENAK